jgi:hypothetical protein
LSGVEAEPVWFLVGWGAPEVEPGDYPVERAWFAVDWNDCLAEPVWFEAERD